MVESLREVNSKCQKPNYKKIGNWMVRHVLRDAALPVTWVLLHTRISANQVTIISLVVGMLGIFTMTLESVSSFLAGVLGLQLWYFLDHVDGQIARYRNTASLSGRFFDFIVHHIIHGILPFGLGLYGYNITQSVIPLLIGFLGSVGIGSFNIINDVKAKTFLERIVAESSIIVNEACGNDKTTASLVKLPKHIFSILHKSIEIHVVMNLLTFFAIIELWVTSLVNFRIVMLIYISSVSFFLAITKIAYLIKSKKIDSEYKHVFSTSPRSSPAKLSNE